jgi:large subunit ribosomal protein L4
MSVTVKSPAGADVGSLELDADTFGIQPNVPVMHQVVTAQLAHRRAGTQSTKTRAEVAGGGRKPYRQKGTGNARQGSTRAPQWSGGGVALGPKPRSYAQRTPKKMVRLALRSALSDRAAAGKVVVVDEWAFDGPRTRDAKAALAALQLTGPVLIVVGPDDDNAVLSFRNLPDVKLVQASELNAYDVLCHEWVVFTRATLPGEGAEAEPSTGAAESAASGSAVRRRDAEEPIAERQRVGADRSEAEGGDAETEGGDAETEPIAERQRVGADRSEAEGGDADSEDAE